VQNPSNFFAQKNWEKRNDKIFLKEIIFLLTIMCIIQYNHGGGDGMPETQWTQSYITELRRGSLVLAALGALRKAHYGYALLQVLQQKGIEIEANTLYPLLRRLESQGLLTSEWDTSESRPHKFYRTSESGKAVMVSLLSEWNKMSQQIAAICEEENR
jgi:DNA-binding PadR family transcriptional regulator